MASGWQNFELGAAGTADLVDHWFGGHSALAADTYASQTDAAAGVTDPTQQAADAAAATQAEATQGVVEHAAKQTTKQVGAGLHELANIALAVGVGALGLAIAWKLL